MNVVAIDPGPKDSAIIFWDGEHICNTDILENELMLKEVQYPWKDCHLAIEMVQSFGMAVGEEVFQTVLWTGRFVQAWEPRPWSLVYRKDVKMHLCQSMRAKDANIRQALVDRFGAVGTKKKPGALYGVKSHLWSALAVAVTWMDGQGDVEGCAGE